MRAFNSASLTILLLSLLSTERTVALQSMDAFGQANYGFKCADRIYKKYEIFAAAKKLCDIKAVNLKARIESHIDFKLPWIRGMSCSPNPYFDAPFAKIPILKDGKIYPIESPPEERFDKDTIGAIKSGTPGMDHLIIDNSCHIVGAYIDYGNEKERGVRYQACTLLSNPRVIVRPLKDERTFCNYHSVGSL